MLSFFLARKYFAHALSTKATSTSLWLSLIVLFVGSLALSLALSITQAFEEKVFAKLQGANADALVFSYGNKLDANDIKKTLFAQHGTIIKAVTEQSMHSVIITHNNHQSLTTLRAIDTETEHLVTNLASKCLAPQTNVPLSSYLSDNKVIMGSTLAKQLNVQNGDTIQIFIPHEGKSTSRIKLTEKTVTIASLFTLGLDEFDANTLFCTLPFFNATFHVASGVDTLLVSFKTPEPAASKIQQLVTSISESLPFANTTTDHNIAALKKTLPHCTVSSWKDLYPALISAFHLEKCGIISIILLFMLVALMNTISVLFTLVHRKQHDIALFQALGMPDATISRIFIWLGMGIVCTSSLAGILLGYTLSFALETYKLVPLPDVYYVSYLPASTNPAIFAFVTALSCGMGFITIFLSVRHIKNNHVLEILRHT